MSTHATELEMFGLKQTGKMNELSQAGASDTASVRHVARTPDEIDLRMLELLSEDGRISVRDLASRVGVSRANAHMRLARLRETGVIEGFSTQLNPKALGLEVTALIMLTVEQHDWRAARDAFESIPEIEYLGFTTGDFDFLALVRGPDMETIRDVVLERLHSMGHVRSTRTVFVLDEVRRRTPLSLVRERR